MNTAWTISARELGILKNGPCCETPAAPAVLPRAA
jgi:hypothetical protein